MKRGIRSRAEGDKSRATPKPGLRCVAMRVLADTTVDATPAPNTATQTQLGVANRSPLRKRHSGRASRRAERT